ncbi:MAG: protein kinase [Gemmataceae bacterium]
MSTAITLSRGCPGREALLDFLLGKLPDARLERIAEHLQGCAACEAELNTLHVIADGDSVGRQVRACLGTSLAADAAALAAVEAQVAALAARTVPERPPAPAHGLPAKTQVGPYRLVEQLGGGGMGIVYRAVQRPIGRMVALKTLRAGIHADPRYIARFRTEGRAVARLHHPNVVQIYAFDEDRGQPYYTMELVEGPTLADRIRRGLAEADAAALVGTVARAVGYAHRNGVLHRDLKPSNILLDPDGIPKVTDFGLAKLLDADAVAHTHADAIVGTPPYMAPEQAAGQPAVVGPHTDVYALGAILYECLTGEPPFRGKTRLHTLELVQRAEVVPPSRRRGPVAADLERICLKCLEKQAADRYPSADALADDLDSFLARRRPVGLPTRRQRAARAVRRVGRAVRSGCRCWPGSAAWPCSPRGFPSPCRARPRLRSRRRSGRAVSAPAAGRRSAAVAPGRTVSRPGGQRTGGGAAADPGRRQLPSVPRRRCSSWPATWPQRLSSPAQVRPPGRRRRRSGCRRRHHAVGEPNRYLFTRAGFSERGRAAGRPVHPAASRCAGGRAPVEAAIAPVGPPVPPAGGGSRPGDVEITVTAETLAARIDGAESRQRWATG